MPINDHNVLPICLLIEDKTCLVVGGGKIATHKVNLLLQAGAQVTVISPVITDEIRSYANNKAITYFNREITDSDIADFTVVYCATNDNNVNRRIIGLCRANRILCCSIDSSWSEGDFLTPASVRHKDLTVSITTGGKACRRSRLVRSLLSRHLSAIDNSTLAVIGTSHLELPTDRREPVHSTGDDYLHKAEMIRQLHGIHEFVFINTCNRIELYFSGTVTPALKHLLCKILHFDSLKEDEFYFKEGIGAFEHGVALCSGLLSQLPGEHHITAQMKDAVSTCMNAAWAGTIMQEWFSSTLHLSREIRQATSSILKNEEYEDVALKYFENEFLSGYPLSITIIGTGVVGSTILNKVLTAYPNAICKWIYHRNVPEIPEFFKNRVALSSFDDIAESLKDADIIISAIRSDLPLISVNHLQTIKSGAILIDLSMPRSIDPAIADSSTLKLLDLDGLKKWYRIEQVDRNYLLSICRNVVKTNRDIYDKIITSITGRNS